MGRVLLIDDAVYARDLMKLILTRGGHEIAGEAGDGYEGVEKYKQIKPDLVILDMIMPRMGGAECLHEIREYDPMAKVLVISADGQDGHIRQLVKDGASGYINKPYKKEAVLEEVRIILDGSET